VRRVVVVVGARPNFVKAAPVFHALDAIPGISVELLHTGQHYDRALSGAFLEQLRLPPPAHHLGTGSGSHAAQTAAVLAGVEAVLAPDPPAAVVVAGDVNSTLGAALAAAKLQVPVAHLEAGLRSFDRTMPEEVNRIATDRLSDLLLCHCEDAVENLRREGTPQGAIELVGNTMIDSLFRLLPLARDRDVHARLGLEPGRYVLVTLHRPSVVDAPDRLGAVLAVLAGAAQRMPVVFPVHPRTRSRLDAAGMRAPAVRLLDPLDYLDFIALEADARLVVTDSGGLQEETSALGVPCLTYRTTTERPVTCDLGTNRLVGTDPVVLAAAIGDELDRPRPATPAPIALWDGSAGPRAAAAIARLVGVTGA
jgi:UDP-N-acetylglucosamine 2-epimerase (non-hydrolysing)